MLSSCKNIQSSKSTATVDSFTFKLSLYFQFKAFPEEIPVASPITSSAVPEYLLLPKILILQILDSFSPSL